MPAIYRYHLSLRYRGYFIVPVEMPDHWLVAVLNPFGQSITDTTSGQHFPTPESCWVAAQGLIDRDISAVALNAPALVPLLLRAEVA